MPVPTKDSELVPWSTNWNTRTVADPADFALTAAQCTAYTAVHTPYITAMAAISSPGAKSKALVATKDGGWHGLECHGGWHGRGVPWPRASSAYSAEVLQRGHGFRR
jgi:hypothetical protein